MQSKMEQRRRTMMMRRLVAAAAILRSQRPSSVVSASSLRARATTMATPIPHRGDRVWLNGRSVVLPSIEHDESSVGDYASTSSISTGVDESSTTSSSLRQRRIGRRLLESVQTYYLPLKEDQLLETMKVVTTSAAGPVHSMTSIVVAANNTHIWYDHWEDGFESDYLSPTQPSTEIWGDSNALNGCAPNVVPCTDASDRLSPGQTIIVEHVIDIPRNASILHIDGGDRIDASFPIAITRAAYPATPDARLGGAVEVVDTDSWGTYFEAPVGISSSMGGLDTTAAFEFVEYYVMAKETGTTVTHFDGTTSTNYDLEEGESVRVTGVKVGDELSSPSPIQVDLLTGDIGSSYETRWYSLLPVSQWTADYYTPVGSEKDAQLYSKVFLYNPDPVSALTVNYDDKTGTNVGTVIVPAGGVASFTLQGATGYRFHSGGGIFFGVAQTDAVGSGQIYDWGHPLIPAEELTSRVIVGLGYACTGNSCTDNVEQPSPIWITPVEDAIISVDYESDGIIDVTYNVNRLDQLLVSDTDQDMSGASIYANRLSDPSVEVDMAAVWGQDPNQSGSGRSHNLDMGTNIVPLPFIEALKTCRLESDNDLDGKVSPGDELKCTIRVTNTGQQTVNTLKFTESLDENVTYVPGSTMYNNDPVPDSPTGDPNPLSGDGLLMNDMNLAVSSDAEICYKVIVDSEAFLLPGETTIEDSASIADATGTELASIETRTAVHLTPSIAITKTVTTAEGNCPGVDLLESVYTGNIVKWCFSIVNTGNTPLGSVNYTDPLLSLQETYPGTISISGTWEFSHSMTAYDNITNTANVDASPLYSDGTQIPEFAETGVSDNDSAQLVALSYPLAQTSADNTVCHYVNMTATEVIEIRGFQFYVNSTDCLSVVVEAREEGGSWYPMCIAEVIGNGPDDYTTVPSFFCSTVTLNEGADISFRVTTEPSSSCYEGGYVPYNSLEVQYLYSEMHCSEA